MEEEFRKIDDRRGWVACFNEIRTESERSQYTYKDAKKLEHKDLNRYRDVNPYDHSRIKLRRTSIDYINACLVKVNEANRAYILTQGPLRSTTGHFWLMVWEQNSRAVLMLNRVVEKNVVKCHQYWPLPDNRGCELTFEDVGLKVKFLEINKAVYFAVTKLLLTDLDSGQSREILHFHYTTWPDFGVPESPAAFLNFLVAVMEAKVLEKDTGPAVIHCSAGIGRSGTFCLVDSCLVMIAQKMRKLEAGKIKQVLLDMRKYRMGLIQTPDQLRFSYLTIIEGAKKFVTLGNFDSQNNLMENKLHNGYSDSDVDSDDSDDEDETPPPIPPRLSKDNSPVHTSPIIESCRNDLNVADNAENKNVGDVENVKDSNRESSNNVSQVITDDRSKNPSSDSTTLPLNSSEKSHDSEREQSSNQTRSNVSSSNPIDKSVNTFDKSTESLLRKRKRQEQHDKTVAKIKEMKEKQVNSETWRKRRRLLLNPVSIGLVVLVGTGFFLYRYMMRD